MTPNLWIDYPIFWTSNALGGGAYSAIAAGLLVGLGANLGLLWLCHACLRWRWYRRTFRRGTVGNVALAWFWWPLALVPIYWLFLGIALWASRLPPL